MPNRRSFRLFTEGTQTEPNYFTSLARRYRQDVIVSISESHGVPRTLVEAAVQEKNGDLAEERRGRGDAFDEYWCIFDHDEHPHLSAAFNMAERSGIHIAFSNPCIELWFLLHFQEQHQYLDRYHATDLSVFHLKSRKRLSTQALELLADDGKYQLARARAQGLQDMHVGNGSDLMENPSSNVWTLVDRLRAFEL